MPSINVKSHWCLGTEGLYEVKEGNRRQFIGVSYECRNPNWEPAYEGPIEHFVLTSALRGCFCEDCGSKLARSSYVLREELVRCHGPDWAIDGEFDVFYHEIVLPPEDEYKVLLTERFSEV